jgi:Bacterial Ig domain
MTFLQMTTACAPRALGLRASLGALGLLSLVLGLVPQSQLLAAPPVGVTERFSLLEDSNLLADPAIRSVLSNDSDPSGRPLEAILVRPPTQGTLVLNLDGSFSYTPAANASGEVTFTYQARTVVPPVAFTIDQAQSRVRLTSKLTVSLINQTRTGDSRVSGSITARVLPTASPFSQVQLVAMQSQLVDQITLNHSILFVGNLTAVTRIVDPGIMRMSLPSSGPLSTVTNGLFDSLATNLNLNGTIDVTSTVSGVNSGPQNINDTQLLDFKACQITSNGTTLTLKVPVVITNTIYIDPADQTAGKVDITVNTAGATGGSGFIVATAPASSNVSELSAPVTVTLSVQPVDDPPVAMADTYYVRQSQPITVAATGAATPQTILAKKSAGWKWFSNTAGTAPPTGWMAYAYDDSAWGTGSAELGYGDTGGTTDGEVQTTSITTPTSGSRYTAYFRKKFTLSNWADTVSFAAALRRDDGCVVWINGHELEAGTTQSLIDMMNMGPRPTGGYPHQHLAATNVTGQVPEDAYWPFTFTRQWLWEGENVIAVEIHQNTPSSTDVSLDLELTRVVGRGGLLANDSDVDTATASLSAIVRGTGPLGTIGMAAGGGFTYTPATGFVGTDRAVYEVLTDGLSTVSPVPLIAQASSWKYLADGTDPGTTWKIATHDDTAWATGTAELGYGDTDEATDIRPALPGPQAPVYPAYFFRQKFTLAPPVELVSDLTLRFRRDDAVALYLNGTQVYRDTILSPTATYTSYTINNAGVVDENAYIEIEIAGTTLALLNQGENILAAEVHQASATSTDVSFSLSAWANVVPGGVVEFRVLSDDADSDGMSDSWERLYSLNTASAADATIDSDGDGMSNRYEFLAGLSPRSRSALLQVTQISPPTGNNLQLSFGGLTTDRRYRLMISDDLLTWRYQGTAFPVSGSTHTQTIPLSGGSVPRFFRLEADFRF